MPGCKLKCTRKQNQNLQNDVDAVPGQSQRAAAPVPCTTVPDGDRPGPSSVLTPALGASQGPKTPPRGLYHSVRSKLSSAWKSANDLWKKSQDPYNWQLLKSITMFTLGLKLFDDIRRHMAKDSTSCP